MPLGYTLPTKNKQGAQSMYTQCHITSSVIAVSRPHKPYNIINNPWKEDTSIIQPLVLGLRGVWIKGAPLYMYIIFCHDLLNNTCIYGFTHSAKCQTTSTAWNQDPYIYSLHYINCCHANNLHKQKKKKWYLIAMVCATVAKSCRTLSCTDLTLIGQWLKLLDCLSVLHLIQPCVSAAPWLVLGATQE